MLMLRLCVGDRVRWARWQITQDLRTFSYTMLGGVLLFALSAGALFIHDFLTTSDLPGKNFMVLRIASFVSIALCTALLHVYLIPRQTVERPLAHTVALALAASVILVSWVIWLLPAGDLTVMQVLAAAGGLTLIIWLVLAAFVIGHRYGPPLFAPRKVAPGAGAPVRARREPRVDVTPSMRMAPRPARSRTPPVHA